VLGVLHLEMFADGVRGARTFSGWEGSVQQLTNISTYYLQPPLAFDCIDPVPDVEMLSLAGCYYWDRECICGGCLFSRVGLGGLSWARRATLLGLGVGLGGGATLLDIVRRC
jgi:hypothetical protein